MCPPTRDTVFSPLGADRGLNNKEEYVDGIHDIIKLINHCAFSSRLPARAEKLAEQLGSLSSDDRLQAFKEMGKVNLIERMASRAAELSRCRLEHTQQASTRIAEAMRAIFGKSQAEYSLKRAGWLAPIASTTRDPRMPIPQSEWPRTRHGFATV